MIISTENIVLFHETVPHWMEYAAAIHTFMAVMTYNVAARTSDFR